jgi:cytochrome d ubiquinol oxidase subunit I
VQVDFLAVLTNNTALAAFSHAIVAALMVAGALLVGIGLWHLRRRSWRSSRPRTSGGRVDDMVWRRSVRLGAGCRWPRSSSSPSPATGRASSCTPSSR